MHADPAYQSAAVYIVKEVDGKRYIATNIKFEEVKEGLHYEPTLRADPEALCELPNDLDLLGLRPTSANAQRGELAATKYHLEDMRLLAKVKPKQI